MNPGEIVTTIIGNLADVPELRFTGSGKAVVNFTIAENHRRFIDGSWTDDGASFVRVTAWGHLAENVCETFSETGMPIMAYGSLRINRWKGDDEVTRDQAVLTAVAVGPNLQFSIADVKRPQNKWGTKKEENISDEMFGSSEEDSQESKPSSDDTSTEEKTAIPRSRTPRKRTPSKTQAKTE
ncbi:single-stranded DNA-binding protein [Streptomyces sp. NPDC020412]|uniref:single-stranded DNA-binding protein n=1 Tax=Streptomyces sp. NPDC020412 TaxID=3365073 RepID=UPI0037B0A573